VRGEAGGTRTAVLSPAGRPYTQEKAHEYASLDHLILICGHYEGFDARILEHADDVVSVGDYILTGGELPAMVITDAVSRMLPGVLGHEDSAPTDSFYEGLLEFPQYTRPREFEGMEVPEVLLNGDHAKIRQWRREQSLLVTKKYRPDLLENAPLTDKDRQFLAEHQD
jgi:tRNA (guanine37-N1)-methyltransferase